MKEVIFYSYPKCSTCRKASKWLGLNNINFKFVDIVKDPPSKYYLELALNYLLLDKKKIFNTRGKSFKLLDFDIKELSNKKIIELLSKNGKLIKRPFLIINETKFLLGFNETEYRNNLIRL